jgi:hypothetical protein
MVTIKINNNLFIPFNSVGKISFRTIIRAMLKIIFINIKFILILNNYFPIANPSLLKSA